jgi:hypothetical protein
MSLGEVRIERYRPTDKRRGIGTSQLMGDHAAEVEGTSVGWIVITGTPVEPFGFRQTTGAMMRHRSCKRLL